MPAINVTCATCRTCTGWTLIIVNHDDDTAADRRSAAKSVATHIAAGRDINTISVEASRTATPCKCPRPEIGRAHV